MQESLVVLLDRQKELVGNWEKLAEEARARVGTEGHESGWPPGYFAGVASGLETAVKELREAASNTS